jgi:deazaflavin-dependent oxidoreductase (nitroreductase family)
VVATIETVETGATPDPDSLAPQDATMNTIDADMANRRWDFTQRDATHLDRPSTQCEPDALVYAWPMPLTGEYVPSTMDWVREQVDTYEATNGREANTLRETGIPIIVVTTKGASSGNVRKFALMRVEHEGEYALVASIGGAPQNPSWFHNLVAEPLCEIQDGPAPADYTTSIVDGDERQVWWDRAVEVFPTYAQYAEKTDRTIPVFIARPN